MPRLNDIFRQGKSYQAIRCSDNQILTAVQQISEGNALNTRARISLLPVTRRMTDFLPAAIRQTKFTTSVCTECGGTVWVKWWPESDRCLAAVATTTSG